MLYAHHFDHSIFHHVLWFSLRKDNFCFGELEFNATLQLGLNGVIRVVKASSFFAEVTLIKVDNSNNEENLKEGFILLIKSAMEEISCRTSSRVTRPPGKFA